MSQPFSSTKLESTRGKFSLKQAAQTTEDLLKEAGLNPEQITFKTEK